MNHLRYWIFLSLILSLFVENIKAQTITLELPDASEESYYMTLCYGLDMDTVAMGNFDALGMTTVELPERNRGYRGIAFLRVKGRPIQLLVINGENFRARLDKNDLIFENSRENDVFYKRDLGLLKDTSLYANRFSELSSYLRSLRSVLSGQAVGLGERYQVRKYATERLNADDLFTSGLWFFVIDDLTKLYASQESFAEAMIAILSRVKSEKVYTKLSENLITIMGQYGWEEAFDIIVPDIVKSGRIKHPQGALYDAFQMAKLLKGSLAPKLEGLSSKLHKGRTLVFFFESDCHNCQAELKKLRDKYSQLKGADVRVVSVSADHDKSIYEKTQKNIPWQDVLCDYKGFTGVNFLNYGIFATPTYFLLDTDGKVVKRSSSLDAFQF